MLAQLSTICLAFAATVQAAISITHPYTNSIWYKNGTVSLNWTLSDPINDTYFFRAYLSNIDQSVLAGNNSIADQTNATAQFVWLQLPSVTSAQGYVVCLVNTTDESQVFATSEEFEIADGTVATVSSYAASTSSSSSSFDLPNVKTSATSSSTSNPFAFPTETATSSAGPRHITGFLVSIVQAGMIAVLVGVEISVAV